MKIAIYGDSYADPSPYPNEGWVAYLNNNMKSAIIDQHGRGGTSHWWSYQKFIETYKDYDTVIFCHTTPMRWPHLPKECEGKEWNTGQIKNSGRGDFQNHINTFFQFIFTEKLLNFHCLNIFKEVNEICQKENIFLINLHMESNENLEPEYAEEITKANYSTFTGLNTLSGWEKVVHKDNIVYTTKELLYKYKISNDVRANHLSVTNNRLLGNLLLSTIENKEYTHNTPLMSLNIWEEFSETSANRIASRIGSS
jgi:hypothetical protein